MERLTDQSPNKSKSKMLKKLAGVTKKEGFQSLRMDDIAKAMDVSRATMYKYFSSKDEVVEALVGTYEDYIDGLVLETTQGEESSFGTRFQRLFEQSIMLIESVTDVFLRDLQLAYPELFGHIKEAMHRRERKMVEFYQDGMKRGVFNQVNVKFLLLQDDVMLREILTAKYIMFNETTLEQVLRDYYDFKKVQLFKAEKLALVNDTELEPIMEHILQKYKQNVV
ncbi:TetR/AcrR family transcriptional regulator [Paenibacillus sp. MBLB2552]|uniref:TetR/AcrR family transcriptional regulator n=1 Tax=Paenibacillus mellifer TaxID=2937794 RepID=A0A9X1Y1F8_9BACL|nr:TetR/AcrR family transcriptional regulator [Paenibacillus mellifer]MCK8489850.1 TetR/AcrR family transcriptional regulator [Paenibacillus mellifer]